MTINEQFRAPHEIIADLLRMIDDDPTVEGRRVGIKSEAAAYLAKVEENRKAWASIEELHKTCIFDQAGIRWDSDS